MDQQDRLSTQEILEKFSDPNLVPHGFLDLSLSLYNPITQQSQLHSKSSQLLSQLDQGMEDLTWQLEDLMTQLKKSGPRLNYQLELLKSGVVGLINDIEEISVPRINSIKEKRQKAAATKVQKPESEESTLDNTSDATAKNSEGTANEKKEQQQSSSTDNGNVIARLRQLEIVHAKIKETQEVFDRASKFDEVALANQVADLIDRGDIEAALKAVESAAELIQVWKGTSIYQTRAKFLAQLRKRIETVLENQDSSNRNNTTSGLSTTGTENFGSSSRASTPGVSSSRPGTPRQKQQQQQQQQGGDSYYGIFGQIQRKIGY